MIFTLTAVEPTVPPSLAGTTITETGERPSGAWYAFDRDDLVLRDVCQEELLRLTPNDLVCAPAIEILWTDGMPTWRVVRHGGQTRATGLR